VRFNAAVDAGIDVCKFLIGIGGKSACSACLRPPLRVNLTLQAVERSLLTAENR